MKKSLFFLLFILYFGAPLRALVQKIYDAFDSDLEKVRLNYFYELENNKGKELIEFIENLNQQANELITKYQYSNTPPDLLKKIKYYEKLTASLKFFFNCASGRNDEKSFSEFELATDFLRLKPVIIKTLDCGKVYQVTFGTPVYLLFFFKNESKAKLKQFNYIFNADKKVGEKWFNTNFVKGNFLIRRNNIEGFAKFIKNKSIQNIRLKSIYCTDFE